MKPTLKPQNPNFSSGPTAKFKGWSAELLQGALTGRSHRSSEAKKRIGYCNDLMRDILGIPDDYLIGILPGSDTGAVEAALWNMLGARGVDVLAWENFGLNWVKDVMKILPITDRRSFEADYGDMIKLADVDCDRDVVFTWNGTTSGVKVPHSDWISSDRKGLTICDATSAVFAMDMPWDKLDVTTFSWQKVLGGEAQHGVMILSPRAVERLNTHKPAWPVPILFSLQKGAKFNDKIFDNNTINTPSMICIEDAIVSLEWAKNLGGLEALKKRSSSNLDAISKWVSHTSWIDFLCADDACRSNTSICLKISDDDLSDEAKTEIVEKMAKLLSAEKVGFDLKAYRTAPAGFRIWGGATVETSDIEALLPWMEWAYTQVKQEQGLAA